MEQTTKFREIPANSESQQPRLSFLLMFIACYLLVATIFQVLSHKPPWQDASPIEYFTGGILWMLSLTCLLIACHYTSSRSRLIFWLMSCAALSVLAIDEIFAFHERPEQQGLFNDDYFKVICWLATAFVFRLVFRMEEPSLTARRAIFTGYLFHSLYILVELGDGEFFRIPFLSIRLLKWSEEFFELFFLASYLLAFVLIHMSHSNDKKRVDQRET